MKTAQRDPSLRFVAQDEHLGGGGEMLIQQQRGSKDARILAEVGGQLQTERKAACNGHGDRYYRGSQSRPRRVHSHYQDLRISARASLDERESL